MARAVVPPGWPPELPPPTTDAFEGRVVGWLLDRGPDGLREYIVWRRQPRALALVTQQHARRQLEGLRQSYSGIRREMGPDSDPVQVDALLVALEAAGTEAAETLRQVELVCEALSGRSWRPRL